MKRRLQLNFLPVPELPSSRLLPAAERLINRPTDFHSDASCRGVVGYLASPAVEARAFAALQKRHAPVSKQWRQLMLNGFGNPVAIAPRKSVEHKLLDVE